MAGSECCLAEFALQLLIAIVLSVPLTLWLMSNGLDNFAYRTDMGVGSFVVSALAATLIAGVVIMYHTLRAAKINPGSEFKGGRIAGLFGGDWILKQVPACKHSVAI